MRRLGMMLAMGAALGVMGCPGMGQPPGEPMTGMSSLLEKGPKGMLAIRAVQGTKGGPAVGGEEVEVVVFHRDVPIKQIKGRLDEKGMLLVGEIPVGMAVTPLVRVRHAGVLYQDEAPGMDATKTAANVDITVYEVTDQEPAWDVTLRHVVADPVEGGYAVSETVVVESRGDRTWMGGPEDAQKRRTTVRLGIPANADRLELVQGFHGWCCTEYAPGTLRIQMPLMPGRMTYKFAYLSPAVDGVVDVRVSAPVKTVQEAVFVPAEGAGVRAEGVEEVANEAAAKQSLRMFRGGGIGAGTAAGVVLTLEAPAATATPDAGVSPAVRWGVSVGAGAVLAAGAWWWLQRSKASGAGSAGR